MKAEKIPMLMGGVLIILLAFLIIWNADILGVAAGRLEQDARERQKIQNNWDVVQAVNEEMGALLFYDEEKQEYAYSIYLSREGMSYGYFYRQGGSDEYMAEGVKGIVFEDKGIALLSLNEDKVSKVVVDNHVTREVMQVDPSEPFAIVLPADCGEIMLYDAQDNIVTLYDTYTGV